MALEEKEILEVEPIIHKKIIELNEFFEIKPKLSVQIIYSPHEFEFYKGEFQNWMVGTASKHHLWIFSKNLIETLTLHKKECFEQVLKHEMSHIYTNTLSPFVNLIFLNNSEGIVSCLLLVTVAIYDIVRKQYHYKEVLSSARRNVFRRK